MAFPTNANQVQAFAGALYGVQVGSVTMAQVNSDIMSSGGLNKALNSYFTASFGSVATATVATSVATNLGLTGAALTAGTAYITAQLNAATAGTRGEVINNILNLFSGLSSDATYGAAATAWNSKVDAAAAYNGSANSAFGASSAGATVQLTVGFDDVIGTAFADVVNARVVQNVNGEQTNQLATGDAINGGAGNDTLTAIVQMASGLNNAPLSAIRPITTDVETALFTALAVNNSNAPSAANEVVTINAAQMIGLDLVGSTNSDASLVIANVNTLKDDGLYANKRFTAEMNVRMDHAGNDLAVDNASNLTVLFDNDYLIAGGSQTDTAVWYLEDRESAKKSASTPLQRINADGVEFTVGGVKKSVKISTVDMVGFLGTAAGAGTWAGYVAVLNTALTLMKQTDSSLVGMTFSLDTSDVRVLGLDGTTLPVPVPAIVLTTKGVDAIAPVGFTTYSAAEGDYDVFAATRDPSLVGANDPVQIDVELFKVGRGAEGGALVIGGMSTDNNNNWDFSQSALKEGIQVFNVTVEGDQSQSSDLSRLASTNNTLEKVLVDWKTGSLADLIIGNHNTGSVLVNGAANVTVDGFNNITTGENAALKDVLVFTANNNNSGKIGNTTYTNDVTLSAHFSDQAVNKYMDRTDIAANPAADNANSVYTTGAGNDSINMNISESNLAASGTAGREDFTMAIKTGAGNDTIETQIGSGQATSSTPWYLNNAIQDNLSIDAGAGDDTIHMNGAGVWAVKAGAGNDAVYSDNSGHQMYDADSDAAKTNFQEIATNSGRAVWVFNSASQTQSSATAQIINGAGLTSAAAATSTTAVANLTLTVTYRGITSDVTVVGTTDSTVGGIVTDLVINQAIKKAINGHVFLKELLEAKDGTGRTLVVNSLTDGVFNDADLSVNLGTSGAANAAQTAALAAVITTGQLSNLGFGSTGIASVAGRFDSAIADELVTYVNSTTNAVTTGGVSIVGAISLQANDNDIVADAGNDTVVLSTSTAATESVNTSDTEADLIFNAGANSSLVVDDNDTVVTATVVLVRGGGGTVSVVSGAITGTILNDTIVGGASNDNITGAAGADNITGGAGIDAIIGGTGADTMTGGADADAFTFATGDTGIDLATADTITDFTTASDTIATSKAAAAGTIADGTAFATFAAFVAAADAVFTAGAGVNDVYIAWNAVASGNAYVAVDENDSGSLDAGDTLIILTGINLAAEIALADLT